MLSPETVGAAPLCVPPDGRGAGSGPFGALLAAPTPPPLRESSHTWMELHLMPPAGSLLQPERGQSFIQSFHIYTRDVSINLKDIVQNNQYTYFL